MEKMKQLRRKKSLKFSGTLKSLKYFRLWRTQIRLRNGNLLNYSNKSRKFNKVAKINLKTRLICIFLCRTFKLKIICIFHYKFSFLKPFTSISLDSKLYKMIKRKVNKQKSPSSDIKINVGGIWIELTGLDLIFGLATFATSLFPVEALGSNFRLEKRRCWIALWVQPSSFLPNPNYLKIERCENIFLSSFFLSPTEKWWII